jgi:hypothetical protein
VCEEGRDDLEDVLHDEVNRLPGGCRAAVVLCYFEGLSPEQAARQLNCPVGTVQSRLARGREKLRVRLTRRGLAPSVGALGLVPATDVAPALPSSLAGTTARMAASFAAGRAAGLGSIPESVSLLTRRMLIIMSFNRIALSVGVTFLLAVATIGISPLARGTSAEPPATTTEAAGKKTAPGDDEATVRPEPILEQAVRAADQIATPWMKAQALADIAAAQARSGSAEPARATFRRAALIIEGLGNDSYSRAASLSSLAAARATAGDPDGARATIAQFLEWASKVDNDRRRILLLQIAAMREAKAGDPRGALAIADAMNDAPAAVRAFVLAEIAGEQASQGDLRDARANMVRADDEAVRAASPASSLDAMRQAQVRGLTSLARAEARSGEVDQGRDTLRRARAIADRIGEKSRPTPLAEIAMAQKTVGDREAAEATLGSAFGVAEGLITPDLGFEALLKISAVQADWGDRVAARETLDKALHAVGEVPSGNKRLQLAVFTARARARARVGDWFGSRKALASLDDKVLKANHLEDVAREQAKAGEARDARSWAEAETDDLLRAHALLGVARGIIERESQPAEKRGKPGD